MERFFELRNEGGPLSVDGRAVARIRRAAGLTQAQVASQVESLGYYLPQPYVSRLERGEYPWGFSERMACALASALGVGVTELTGGRLMTKADIQHIRGLASQLDDAVEPRLSSASEAAVS